MSKLELAEYTAAKKINVNTRTEMHGKEEVAAMDLRFSVTGGNELLDLYSPKLREGMFHNADADNGQLPAEGIPQVLPNLRFPLLCRDTPLKWGAKEKLVGYRLFVQHGLDEEPIFLDLCKVKDRTFECIEGGSVTLSFTVQASGDQLTREVRGILTEPTGGDIQIKLLAPVTEAQQAEKDKAEAGTDGGGALFEGAADENGLDPNSPEGRFVAGAEDDAQQ